MQAKIYLTVRCVLAVTRSLSRKFKALSKEDFGCSSVHVFESTGRDDALKKLKSSVIVNVAGNLSALGQQDSYCRSAASSICDCSSKLLASVRYFSRAYHKFKPRSYLTFAPLCNYFRAVQSYFRSAGELFFKERRLIPTTCVASVLLSSS